VENSRGGIVVVVVVVVALYIRAIYKNKIRTVSCTTYAECV